MVEQVLPQCRRVLLDPTMRARYDEENARHARGEADALDYVAFMANLQGASTDARQALARSSTGESGEFDLLPERVRDEITLARAVIEAVQSGSEFDLLPARALSAAPSAPDAPDATSLARPTEASDPGVDAASVPSQAEAAPPEAPETPEAPAASRLTSRPRPQPPSGEYFFTPGAGDIGATDHMAPTASTSSTPAASTPAAAPSGARGPSVKVHLEPPADPPQTAGAGVEASEAPAQTPPSQTPAAEARTGGEAAPRGVTEVPDDTRPVIRAQVIEVGAGGKSLAQLREEAEARALGDGNKIELGKNKAPERRAYQPRVSVGDEEPPAPAPRRAILSPVATHMATGVVSAALMLTIWSMTADPPAAPRDQLSVVHASGLSTILRLAEEKFEAAPENAGTDVVLKPMDARAAMNYVLSSGASGPDVWIPSEAVWSSRYNEVAPKFKRRAISSPSAIAPTPLVLVARADRAGPLRVAFPSRKIPSWDALRQQVAKNCASHFGMTSPEESGGGALVRYVMAREWCESNKVAPTPAAMADERMWKWLSSFENNVPQFKSAGDMVKDLALGTTGQYWWALAYESDAISYMGQGKPLEIFYLPSTFYADHPFCRLDRGGRARPQDAAAARFEQFLASPPMQQAILQAGYRAPEIDLAAKVENNPFQGKNYAARGVRVSGFNVGRRLDYAAANALAANWKSRNKSF
jgi:hypothetical protein